MLKLKEEIVSFFFMILLWVAELKAKQIAVEYLGVVQFAALGYGHAVDDVVVVAVVVVAETALDVDSVGIARAADASRAPRRPDF